MQINQEQIRKIVFSKTSKEIKFDRLCILFNEAYDYAYQEGLSMYRDDC